MVLSFAPMELLFLQLMEHLAHALQLRNKHPGSATQQMTGDFLLEETTGVSENFRKPEAECGESRSSLGQKK